MINSFWVLFVVGFFCFCFLVFFFSFCCIVFTRTNQKSTKSSCSVGRQVFSAQGLGGAVGAAGAGTVAILRPACGRRCLSKRASPRGRASSRRRQLLGLLEGCTILFKRYSRVHNGVKASCNYFLLICKTGAYVLKNISLDGARGCCQLNQSL